MRKWRPWEHCIYIIPEVHGNIEGLSIILDRILPLRTRNNPPDQLVFLGDYIGKGLYSSDVINLLIEIKQSYKDSIIFLRGNHEAAMIEGLVSNDCYYKWLANGGEAIMRSYLGKNSKPSTGDNHIPFNRLSDIIPTAHVTFLQQLAINFIKDEYLMFHGGINLENPSVTTSAQFVWDCTASRQFKSSSKMNLPLDTHGFIYVAAHNYGSKLPFIHKHYYMLGGGAPQNLLVMELNSMMCSMVKRNKSRIYRHEFKYFE